MVINNIYLAEYHIIFFGPVLLVICSKNNSNLTFYSARRQPNLLLLLYYITKNMPWVVSNTIPIHIWEAKCFSTPGLNVVLCPVMGSLRHTEPATAALGHDPRNRVTPLCFCNGKPRKGRNAKKTLDISNSYCSEIQYKNFTKFFTRQKFKLTSGIWFLFW